jgi:hypothetical protein
LGIVQEYEERKRHAEEAAFNSRSAMVMLNATTANSATLKKQDDQQIVDNWTKTSAAVKQTLKDDPDFAKMSPRAQAKLKAKMDIWQGKSTSLFQEKADMLGSKRRARTAIGAKNAFAKTGDDKFKTNAIAALDAQHKAGDLTNEQYNDQVAGLDSDFERGKILNGIDANAYATLQKINAGGYKHISETEMNTLKNAAEKQVNFVQKTTGDEAIADYVRTNIPADPKTLQDKVKAGTLTGDFVKSYNAMVSRKGLDEARDQQSLLLMEAHDLDVGASDNPEKDIRAIRDDAAKLPPTLQRPIVTYLDQKMKQAQRQGTSEETPVVKTQLELMKQTFDKRQQMGELDKADFRSKYGSKVPQPVVEAERLRYAKAQQQFLEWSQSPKGTKAGPEEAAAERERLGFGQYQSKYDVVASFQAGRIDASTTRTILASQFGIQ